MKPLYRTLLTSLAGLCSVLLLTQCGATAKTFKVAFNGDKEMSGAKCALSKINPALPADWDGYNFVVIEYKITTAQRFQLGFTTDWGYNELRVMSYVPNAWNRLAIPLKYFTQEPDAAVDLAATYNHARYTGWINLGGKRGPMHGVDSIGVRMRRAIGKPTIEIRNVTLSVEDPGDLYMEKTPAVDEFGQSINVSYPEKAKSLEDLQKQWKAEEDEVVSTEAFNYSKFGGYKQKQVEATGYFRTQEIDGKWWFVDPEGYLFLSVGIDCVNIGGGGSVRDYDQRPNMYKQLPPENLAAKLYPPRRAGTTAHPNRGPQASFGMWNLFRRYGDDFRSKAQEMVIKRMDKWGLNTIANWSSTDIMSMNKKAFLLPLYGLGQDSQLMGLCDVYAPDYKAKMEAAIQQYTTKYADNPWLIGYFVGNEPAWINLEPRLCQLILEGPDRPVKTALKSYLTKNGDNDTTRRAFVIESFRIFLQDANTILKKNDPHHLNLGIRFGDPDGLKDDLLIAMGQCFDVFSFNCYALQPKADMMTRVLKLTGRPMIIGEYHFGTVDRGLAQSLWQVESEAQRGVAYRYYTEQAYSHPGLIGTGYFQWSDEDLTGRFDGENYNCGVVDVTDRPYREQVEAMTRTSKVLFYVHSGKTAPFSEQPVNARGHEAVPDLWNK